MTLTDRMDMDDIKKNPTEREQILLRYIEIIDEQLIQFKYRENR